MKKRKLIMKMLIVLCLLILTSCDDNITILVMPKDKNGDYCISKVSYFKWANRGGDVTLLDEDNNKMQCTGGRPRMVKDALSCIGKKFLVDFTCIGGSTAEVNYTSVSCTESIGTAVLSTGREFDVYIGRSDEFINNKIAEYNKKTKK